MRPATRELGGQQDLFRSRLDQIINMNHELVKLAKTIAWASSRSDAARSTRMAPACRLCRRG